MSGQATLGWMSIIVAVVIGFTTYERSLTNRDIDILRSRLNTVVIHVTEQPTREELNELKCHLETILEQIANPGTTIRLCETRE